jgi:soluble lytic murein transglycosylase-like protein
VPRLAAAAWQQLAASTPRMRLLNNPEKVLGRYELMCELTNAGENQYRARRLNGGLGGLRSNWRRKNTKMPVEEIHQIVTAASRRIGVAACLVHAVILYESVLNPNAISTTGAMGLMALQPATARVHRSLTRSIRMRMLMGDALA